MLQLSSETTTLESFASFEISAADTSLPLQPNKHPPAIHTDTQSASNSREALMTSVKFIRRKSTPVRRALSRKPAHRSKNTKAQKHRKFYVTGGLLA
jgi:hypothetical protein